MKYKVGDKVKIREDLVVGNIYGADDFAGGMEKYKGKIATISSMYDDNRYYIDINDDECEDITWRWTDEMFEDVKEVNDNKQVRTVDVGFHLDYCGHKVIKNVWQGGWATECKERSVFFTTYDCKNQYTLPLSAIDWVIPHED